MYLSRLNIFILNFLIRTDLIIIVFIIEGFTADTRIIAWISIGSTYIFLTALRLGKIIEQEKLDVLFKPFSVRNIMREMDNIPFPPEKQPK